MKTFKQHLGEDLRKWFKQKWVRMDTKGNIKGDCAREPGEGKPKCLPQAKAHAIGKEARASAAQRKRREDPNPERRGAPINVRTEACWTGYTAKGMKKKGNRMVPNCVPEEAEALSLDYGNASIHHSKEAALSKATKLHKAGYVGITLKVHPNGLHVVDHKGKKEIKEDGMGGGAMSAGPTNVVSSGAIAGTGGKGGEPGVNLKKKKTPVLMSLRRKTIKA